MDTSLFDGILGHERNKQGLLKALAQGRIHHAWLFSGRSGIGKRQVLLRLAQLLNCEQSRLGAGLQALAACGECRHCHRIDLEQHPDFEHIVPDGRTLRIQQIRALQKKITFHPYEARWRVVLIEDAHKMRVEAANALLKTLEEPTEGTIIVLLTDQHHRLLPTIISRCQTLRFSPFSALDLRAFLLQRDVTPEHAQLISVLAQGSLGRALELSQSDVLDEQLEHLAAIRDIQMRGILPAMSFAAQLGKSREQVPTAMTILRAYFRDLMLLCAGIEADKLCFNGQIERLRDDAKHYDVERLGQIIDAIDETELAIEGNVHAQLSLESLFLDIAAIQRSRPPLRRRRP